MLQVLDVRTLLVVAALIVGFSGVLLTLTREAGPVASAGRGAGAAWGGAMLAGAVALLLEALLPDAEGAGTALLLVATALSWVGAARFVGRPPSWGLVALGPLAWSSARLASGGTDLVGPACLIGAVYILAGGWVLGRDRREALPARPAAVALLVVHGGVFAVRGMVGVLGLGPAPGALQAVLLLEGTLHAVGLTFLLQRLTMERAERRQEAALRALALQDGLTGIGNRRLFDERLAAEWRRAVRTGHAVSLLMIDVDHFKRFNDTHGHQRGDDCLRQVAQAVAGAAGRPADVVARYGGEEFVVLLPDTAQEGALEVAERAHGAVRGVEVPGARGGMVGVSVSVGVATAVRAQDGGAAALLLAADRALYAAKAAGRDRVEVG